MTGAHSGMTHEERLVIAGEISRRILETYGDTVLAVFITSSTAKGLDRAHSDLEVSAVVRDGVEIEDRSYVFRGILVEIDYPQESRVLRAARRVTSKWPIEADGYRSRLVLFEREGWLRRLDEAVAESDSADSTRALQRATTSLVENRDKLRNAGRAGDVMDIRVNGFWTAYAAAILVLLLNRRYMITSSWLYRQAFECPDQPKDFRHLAEILVGVGPSSADEIAGATERLCDNLLAMVNARGISVESDELIV